MPNPDPLCTCWRLQTETGETKPCRWVAMHDAVRLVCTDGRVIEGFSMGGDWWGPADHPLQLLDVEADGGEEVIVERHEIATLTPLGGIHDSEQLLARLGDLLQRPGDVTGEVYFRLLVDDHTTFEITLRRETYGCSPGPNPYA